MSYLADNPLPLMMLLAAIAVAAMLIGSAKGRGVAGICLFLGVGLFFLERYLVTPVEQVESQLEVMLQHFKDRDIEAISAQISDDNQKLKDIAKGGLDLVDLDEKFALRSVDVTIEEGGTRATAMVRANGTVGLRKHGGAGQHVPTFWKTIWLSQGDDWKLHEVTRLNPGNGQEMGYYSAN